MTEASNTYEFASQEDRSAPRCEITIPAQFRVSGESAFKTVVHDLSLSGFSVTAMNPLKPGQRCWLSLPGMETQPAQVIWWDYSQAGCAFSRLLDPAAMGSLLERYSNTRAARRS